MKNIYDDTEEFKIQDVLEALTNKDTEFLFAGGRKKRALMRILNTKEFHEWLWNPNNDEKNLAGSMEALYTELSKISNLERLEKILSNNEYDDFTYPRGVVTFVSSVSAFASDVAPKAANNAKSDLADGRITKKTYLEEKAKTEMILELADDIMHSARDIIDYEASKLSHKTNLPKKYCKIVLTSCPEREFIPKYRIGYWLMNLLAELYALADSEPEKFSKGYYGNLPKFNWNKFFAEVFGEDNVVECASYIILEGMKRISNYKSDKVEIIWKSLTRFALETLDEAPSGVREHMIELYLKRLDSMFANGTYDIRVNLLELKDVDYPELVKTVEKYATKISDLIAGKKKTKK